MPRNESSRPAGKRPLRSLSAQEKVDAINRVHNGESKAAVARDIGVPESTLRGWCKAEEKIRSQLNSMRQSGTYEQGLTTSSSDSNSPDNSRPGSSSRSTPTAQNSITPNSGATDRLNEEPESSPAPKRTKITENNSAASISIGSIGNIHNNVSTSTCASVGNEQALNSYIFNLLANANVNALDPTNSAVSMLNMISRSPYHYLGYGADAANLLLHKLNGANPNMTMPSMMPTSNVLLNGNKRKYSASTSTTMPDIQTRVSSRRQHNQSPQKFENLFPSINNQTSFTPSTSANNGYVGAAVSSKSSKNLNAVICQLQQQKGIVPVFNTGDESVPNAVTNNNNKNVHNNNVNNETKNLKLTNSLPPGFDDARSNCKNLYEWLRSSGSPKFTFQQIKSIKVILDSLDDWSNSMELESKKKSNGTS